jgi:hypothetical protein
MIIIAVYIMRIFSERFTGLSAYIAVVPIILFIYLFFISKKKLIYNTNEPFIKFIIIYVIVHLMGMYIGFLSFGNLLIFQSLYFIFKPLTILCLFFIFQGSNILSIKGIKYIIYIHLVIYSIISVTNTYSVMIGEIDRAFWPSYHSNNLVVILNVFLFFSIYKLRSSLFKKIIIVSLILGLFATKSLSGLLLFLIIFFIYNMNSIKVKEVIFYLILGLFVLPLLFSEFLQQRFDELVIDTDLISDLWNLQGLETNSFEWRIINWRGLFDLFIDSPIFGNGTISWMYLNPLRHDVGNLDGYNPHMEFIGWLMQFGIVGTLILSFYSAKTIKCYLPILMSKASNYRLSASLFCGILVEGFFGNEILYLHYHMCVLLIYFYEKFEIDSKTQIEYLSEIRK